MEQLKFNPNSVIQILPITWLLFIIQNLFLIYVWYIQSPGWSYIFQVLGTNVLLIMIVQWFNSLLGKIKILAGLFNFIILILYSMLWGYHFWIGAPMDYLLAYESLDNFKYGETLEMAVQMDWLFVIRLILIIIILYAANKVFHIFNKAITTFNSRKFFFSSAILALMMMLHIPHKEELLTFTNSYISYNYRGNYNQFEIPEGSPTFPYLHVNELNIDFNQEVRPHVFLILLESCNSSYLESSNEHNTEYMPFMNSLIKKGIYVENFYSNSVFTGKGHFAVLTGIFPSIGQSVFSHYPNLNTKSIPEVLQDAGYRTLFFHGYHDLTFGGARQFYETMNFDLIKQMDEEFITKADLPYIWGWGLQDDKFFEKFFNYLDKDHQMINVSDSVQTPYFSVLGTMSHHFDFKSYPKELAYIYPNPKTDAEYFANSIHLEDLYLRTFFSELDQRDYLDNRIIILVGDHGFPSQGLDVEYNGNFIYSGYQEDRFRTPLLILQEGTIQPQRITKAHSQIDIAPTILDLLGIKALNAFQGVSIFDTSQNQHIVQLVQPYDGLYISSLEYPYKYVYQEHTGRELFFNLGIDPNESNNIIQDISDKEMSILQNLRSATGRAYLNQKLIESNRIWPNK